MYQNVGYGIVMCVSVTAKWSIRSILEQTFLWFSSVGHLTPCQGSMGWLDFSCGHWQYFFAGIEFYWFLRSRIAGRLLATSCFLTCTPGNWQLHLPCHGGMEKSRWYWEAWWSFVNKSDNIVKVKETRCTCIWCQIIWLLVKVPWWACLPV